MSWKLKVLAVLNVAGWAILVPLLVSNLLNPFLHFDKWPGSTLTSRPPQQATMPNAHPVEPRPATVRPLAPERTGTRVGPVTIVPVTPSTSVPAPTGIAPVADGPVT